ncbi:MAG: hypothetical protein ACREPS_04930 [Rhodanobacteraceae bacterium]
MSQSNEAVEFFDEHGWVVFRNVFDATEIREFRGRVERIRQTGYAGDLLSNKDFGGCRFILDERIVGIVRTILRAAPCYFGDSSASIDVGAMGFHKDNPDREDARAPDWRSPYTLVRVGLYLQDHAFHSGGLAVRDGSHLAVNRNKGRPLAIPSQPGDLVLWSLRTTHSGYAARLKAFPKVFVPMPVVKVLGSSSFAREHVLPGFFRPLDLDGRLAIFATYGADDEHQARYLAYLRTRQYAVGKWRATVYDQSVFDAAQARGVKLISMREQVSDLDVSKLNSAHVDLPW